MTLDEIFAQWGIDSKVDRSELGNAALEIPKLHHRYYRMLSTERTHLRELETRAEVFTANKRAWMAGTLTREELAELGWKVNLKKYAMKADAELALKSDPDMIQMTLALGAQKEKIELLTSIISMIAGRSYQLSAAINYEKFKSGIG